MIHLRDAELSDAKLLNELIEEMGRHERMSVRVCEKRLIKDGFGAAPKFRVLIAEVGSKVAGYALLFECYSSFQGSGIFLEDLFVRDAFRGKGVGGVLLSRIASEADERGCFGVLFNVLEWNHSALEFFRRAGASVLLDRKTFCLPSRSLRELEPRKANEPLF